MSTMQYQKGDQKPVGILGNDSQSGLTEYEQFLKGKTIQCPPSGCAPASLLNPMLFDYQEDIVKWALARGKAAVWADCGLGKGPIQLEWCKQQPYEALIVAPLAVAHQFLREAEKFGIELSYARNQSEIKTRITVTNYERLEKFDAGKFGAVSLDESSILKGLDGQTRKHITEEFRNTPFRLASSATPAPNNFMEIGSHAEFLGVLTRTEMLSTFFVHDGGDTAKWRLKGHAEEEYWRWMCQWAVMMRRPSDLGYADDGFILPSLNYQHHVVKSAKNLDGFLFPVEAQTLIERRGARRGSLQERVTLLADLMLNLQPCGNGNTKKIESENSPTTRNMQSGTITTTLPDGEIPNSISSTCGNGTSETNSILKLTTQTRKTLHVGDAGPRIDTPTTQSIDSNGKMKSQITTDEILPLKNDSTYESLESRLSNTENRLRPKADDAQSAGDQKTDDINTSWLTIATPLEKSEDYFADGVILESGNSKMIRSESKTQLNISEKPQWVVWCGLNAEQDALAKICGDRCVSIYGSLSDSEKERRLAQWLNGEKEFLLSKVSIFGWGLNLQQCFNVGFLGISDSFEEMYQGIRRCWRFGQKNEVNCHVITGEAEGAVVRNIQRKEADAARMAKEMVKHMSVYNSEAVRGTTLSKVGYVPQESMRLPSWI